MTSHDPLRRRAQVRGSAEGRVDARWGDDRRAEQALYTPQTPIRPHENPSRTLQNVD